jgi:hypothetical protein
LERCTGQGVASERERPLVTRALRRVRWPLHVDARAGKKALLLQQ